MKFFCLVLLSLLFSPKTMAQKRWGLGASYLYSQVNYKEPSIMNEKGALSGVGLEAQYNLFNWAALNLQGKWLQGNLEYDGSTFSGTPLSQTTKDVITEYRGLLALKWGHFSPYAGYGQRYWMNDLVISYRRETTYHYVPIGFRYVWRPLYISYESRQFLDGLNVSHMSDIGGGRSDVKMKQKSGKGYALEAGVLARISTFDLKISLGYEYWGIEDSETSNDGVDTLVEPHNSTNTYTLGVGVYF